MLTSYDVAGIVITLTAVLAFINYRFMRLPHAIGLTVLGMAISFAVAGIDVLFPRLGIRAVLQTLLNGIGFDQVLMNGMLSFLLFAGALDLDMTELKAGRRPVLILSLAGVLLSTFIIGILLFLASRAMSLPLSLPWCFLFGALISPTDPVAVIAILRDAGIPLRVETRVAAESLFNDGVGVVVFSIAAAAAIEHQDLSLGGALEMFAVKGIGGGAFGLLLGWLTYRSLKVIDDALIETIITVALVMGGYALATHLGLSSVVAMAVAGCVIARYGKPLAMAEGSRTTVVSFWHTLDGILNSVLFVLIGLEVVAVLGFRPYMLLALAAIPIVLAGRALSVGIPMAVVSLFAKVETRAFGIFVWGGLRGGIPIALVLSLPYSDQAEILLTLTYFVVVFSVVVQGSTLKHLARRLYPDQAKPTRSGFLPGG